MTKFNLKTTAILFAIFSVLTIFSTSSLKAEELTPNSGNYPTGSTVTFKLTAHPNTLDENAIKIRLTVDNMTIQDFVPVSGANWIVTKDCSNQSYFDSTHLCLSLGKTSNIISGEDLGILILQMPSQPGVATITKDKDNAYSSSKKQTTQSGLLATFNIVSPQSYPLSSPISSPITSSSNPFVNFIYVAILIIGVIIACYLLWKFALNKQPNKSKKIVGIVLIALLILSTLFISLNTLQNQGAQNTQAADTCPSTQARFRLTVNGTDLGLVQSGSWPLSSVQSIDTNTVTDMQANPPLYFNGTERLIFPNSNQTDYPDGSSRPIAVSSLIPGEYTLEALAGSQICDMAKIKLTAPVTSSSSSSSVSSQPSSSSSSITGITCGPIDTNGDNKLGIVDLNDFAKVYQSNCSDNSPKTGCGPKDTNGDHIVDIVDLAAFAKYYGQASCTGLIQ